MPLIVPPPPSTLLCRRARSSRPRVDGLMKGAGLTHGSFYASFKSKEELAAKSCERTLAKLVEDWKVAGEANGDPVKAIVAGYLSISHRDDPGNGCVVAVIGADVARKTPAVRHAVSEGIRRLSSHSYGVSLDVPGLHAALAKYASLVGAMVLGRAVDDPALSKQILQAVAVSV
jgi:TetR/AcrR family transcriptional repressor of nem operon